MKRHRSKRILIQSGVLPGLVLASCLWGEHAAGQDVPAAAIASVRAVPLSPEESADLLVLEAGYTATLIAAEPEVVDPVEVAFDASKRMWVVEMSDYPFRIAEQPQGRIRVLSDPDASGRYRTAVTFAEGLEMPTGLALWRGGALVTVAGKLVYFPDQDGDLKADRQVTWLEGFQQDNEQLRANHPQLGPDGNWYVASGLRGGNVRLLNSERDSHPEGASRTPAETETNAAAVQVGSRDVRFDRLRQRLQLVTGPAQFGLTFDSLGNRIFCSNRNPAVQVIFEQEDLDGNPLGGLVSSTADLIPAGADSRVLPIVDAWTTSNLHAGQYTAACGVMAWEPSGGQPGQTSLLVCEPTGSLVSRDVVSRGASSARYESQLQTPASEKTAEWLASTDPWFRPVNIALAPDDCVAVVDMHRAVIEHPQWVPDELKQRADERYGNQAGRVYLIRRVGSSPEPLKAGSNSNAREATDVEAEKLQLAREVSSQDAWQGRLAARRLLESPSSESGTRTAVLSALTHAAVGLGEGSASTLAARIRAAQLSMVLAADRNQQWLNLLQGEHQPPHVIAACLRLLQVSESPTQSAAVWRELTKLCMSQHNNLRFEALLALGRFQSVDPTELSLPESEQSALVAAAIASPQLLVALASAYRSQPDVLLEAIMESQAAESATAGEWLATAAERLVRASLKRDSGGSPQLAAVHQQALGCLSPPAKADPSPSRQLVQISVLKELVAAARQDEYADWMLTGPQWQRVEELAKRASETDKSEAVRGQAIRLLALAPNDSAAKCLANLASQHHTPSIATAVWESWGKTHTDEIRTALCDALLGGELAPRPLLLRLISARQERLESVAEYLESGKLTPQQLGASALQTLTSAARGATRVRLSVQLETILNSNRKAIVDDYAACLELEADARNGKTIFKQRCAACHKIDDLGIHVGPDISDLRTKRPIEILTAILDPNLAVDNNYFRCQILLQSGSVIEGMIVEETQQQIILRNAESARVVVPRDEIDELKRSGLSLMPEGLESQISQQEMANLIHYVKNWRYLTESQGSQ